MSHGTVKCGPRTDDRVKELAEKTGRTTRDGARGWGRQEVVGFALEGLRLPPSSFLTKYSSKYTTTEHRESVSNIPTKYQSHSAGTWRRTNVVPP